MPKTLTLLTLLALLVHLAACTDEVDEEEDVPLIELDWQVVHDARPLSETAQDALAVTPRWLRHDMALAMRRVSSEHADELAVILLDVDDDIRDEVAFTLAHIGPDLLESEDFYPQLAVQNAEWVYAVNQEVDYVELVEEGSLEEGDWWTTASYTIWVDDVPTTRTLEREDYYWYVVHPRVEDDMPWYVDPWQSCGNELQCPSDPDDGYGWRAFLWELAESDCEDDAGYCPIMRDWFPGQEYTWDGNYGAGLGAIGEIHGFLKDESDDGEQCLAWGAEGERSVQPNRIYALGRGNCGEHADMTTAVGRTALLPLRNVNPGSRDHTWDEFHDGEAWVVVDTCGGNYLKEDYSGNARTGLYSVRGDARTTWITEHYADEELFWHEVEVLDADGAPVAGAQVDMYGTFIQDGTTYWWYTGSEHTDVDGVARFELMAFWMNGDEEITDNDYGVVISSDLGNYPEEENMLDRSATNPEAGSTVEASFNVAGTASSQQPAVEAVGCEGTGATLVLNAEVEGRFLSASVYGSYTETAPTPELVVHVMSMDQLESFQDGDETEVLWTGSLGESIEVPGEQELAVVLSNTSPSGHRHAALASVSLAYQHGEQLLELDADLQLLSDEYVAWALLESE